MYPDLHVWHLACSHESKPPIRLSLRNMICVTHTSYDIDSRHEQKLSLYYFSSWTGTRLNSGLFIYILWYIFIGMASMARSHDVSLSMKNILEVLIRCMTSEIMWLMIIMSALDTTVFVIYRLYWFWKYLHCDMLRHFSDILSFVNLPINFVVVDVTFPHKTR
jgi:hypothetical protein